MLLHHHIEFLVDLLQLSLVDLLDGVPQARRGLHRPKDLREVALPHPSQLTEIVQRFSLAWHDNLRQGLLPKQNV